MDEEMVDFLAVLGVTVQEVDDVCMGECAMWYEYQRVVKVCRRLGARERAVAMNDLLGRIVAT